MLRGIWQNWGGPPLSVVNVSQRSNDQLSRYAVEHDYLSQEAAQKCLVEASRTGADFLRTATEHGFLSQAQAQALSHVARLSGSEERVRTRVIMPDSDPRSPERVRAGHCEGKAHKGPLKVGERVGAYRIVRFLAMGGMGVLYLVRHEQGPDDGPLFVLKVLKGATHKDDTSRFEREAQAAAAVDKHPNIVTIHSFGQHKVGPYMVLDYVQGRSLDQELADRDQGFSEPEALNLVLKLGQALVHAHGKGVYHRDLKPQNVLVRDLDGEVLLTDFGLAKKLDAETLTRAGDVLGTPHYMSPEQIRGQAVRGDADVWALAVLLFELLSKQRPFPGMSFQALAHQITKDPPADLQALRPGVSQGVTHLIHRALNKDRQQRVSEMTEFVDLLQTAKRGGPIKAPETRRSWRALSVVGVALLALLLVVIGVWSGQRSAQRERVQAALARVPSRDGLETFVCECLLQRVKDTKIQTDHLKNIAKWRRLSEHLKGLRDSFRGDQRRRWLLFEGYCELVTALTRQDLAFSPELSEQDFAKAFLVALRAFDRGQYGQAAELFRDLGKQYPESKRITGVMNVVVAVNAHSWSELFLAWPQALPRQVRNDLIQRVMTGMIDSIFQVKAPDIRSGDLNLLSARYGEGFWSDWNQKVKLRCQGIFAQPPSIALLRKIDRVLSELKMVHSQAHYPGRHGVLTLLGEAEELCEQEKFFEAFENYRRVRAVMPQFKLDENFPIRDLEVSLVFNNKDFIDSSKTHQDESTLLRMFAFMVEVGHMGAYLDALGYNHITQLYNKGHFNKPPLNSHSNSILCFWRAKRFSPTVDLKRRRVHDIEEDWKAILSDLDSALRDPQLSPNFRAEALIDRVRLRFHLVGLTALDARGRPDGKRFQEALSKVYSELLAELAAAEKLYPVFPERIPTMRFRIARERMSTQELCVVLDQAEQTLKKRFLAGRDYGIRSERPALFQIGTLEDEAYRIQLTRLIDLRFTLLAERMQTDAAEEQVRRRAKVLTLGVEIEKCILHLISISRLSSAKKLFEDHQERFSKERRLKLEMLLQARK